MLSEFWTGILLFSAALWPWLSLYFCLFLYSGQDFHIFAYMVLSSTASSHPQPSLWRQQGHTVVNKQSGKATLCFTALSETPTAPTSLDASQGSSSLGCSLKSWGLSYPTLLSWPQATTLRHRRWAGLCLKETGRIADEHGPGTLSIEINAIKSGSSWHLYKGRCYSYPSCLVPHTPNSPLWDYWRSKVSLNNSHSMWFTALPESNQA